MTACKDSQATSGKKAVSATLAGVLAVGLVPAVALADEAVEVTEEDGITERNTTAEAIMNGTIVLKAGQTAGQEFPSNATPNYLIGTAVQVQGTTGSSNQLSLEKVRKTTGNAAADWYYVKISSTGDEGFIDQNGKAIKVDLTTDNAKAYTASMTNLGAGEWALVMAKDNGGSLQPVVKQAATFTAKPASLADAIPYEVGSNTWDTSDTTFSFNNKTWKFGANATGNSLNLVLNGIPLSATNDYTATVYGPDGKQIASGEMTYAGKYRIVIDGKAGTAYENDKNIVKYVEISPLDLSVASVYYAGMPQIPASTAGEITEQAIYADTTTVNGQTLEELGLSNGTNYFIDASELNTNALGGHEVSFSADIPDDAENPVGTPLAAAQIAGLRASFTGTATGTLYVVSEQGSAANLASSAFSFNGAQIGTGNAASIKVDYSQKAFQDGTTYNKWNSDLVKVTVDGNVLDPAAYNIEVLDSEGNDVGVAGLAKKGDYAVSVAIDPANTDPAYAFAGKSDSMTVSVTYGEVEQADVAFTADGKLIPTEPQAAPTANKGSVTYTGSPISIGANVMIDNKEVPSSDYTITITKDGQTVTEVKDAGTYVVTVSSDKYFFKNGGNVLVLTVAGMPVTPVGIKGSVMVPYKGTQLQPTIFYTGSEISPVVVFKDAKGNEVEVPTDAFSLSYTYKDGPVGEEKTVDAIKDAGVYMIDVADALKDDNYDVQDLVSPPYLLLIVSDEDVFIDVPADAWFATPVYKAAALEYMSGYAGTHTFGPYDDITRGQVACVLFNMAGATDTNFTPEYDENKGVVTGFSDVDGHMYYAKAIAWAKSTGVINGFAGTDQFGPDQNITREQFAAMLANYAKMAKDYDFDASQTGEVLGSMPDGSAVSDWARESVAWAVAGKVMGNGGTINPLHQIPRAEVAAMAVNYQPERPDTIL